VVKIDTTWLKLPADTTYIELPFDCPDQQIIYKDGKKETKIILAIAVSIPILIYLMFAFILLDANPFNWTQANRISLVFADVMCVCLGMITYGLSRIE